MKKCIYCIILCLCTWLTTSSQQINREWTTNVTTAPTNILSSNIHLFDEKIGVSLTDEDALQSFMEVLNSEGDLTGQISIPVDYLLVSYYSKVDSCFYFAGSQAVADSMIFAKMTSNGITLWRKAFLFDDYASNAPYKISERDDEILLSYSLFNFSGPFVSSAVGYFVFDRNGDIIRQNQPFAFPTSQVPIISYTSALDKAGNAVLALTNFLGPCSIVKFDKMSGIPLWTQNFDLENNDIQALWIDNDDNIFFSGHDNSLIKLKSDGSFIFEKELGPEGFHVGQNLLVQGGYLYVVGYHFQENVDNSQIYIGQFDPLNGERNWEWYFDGIPNQFGLGIEDGAFANDSTLYVLGSVSAEYEFVMKLTIKGTVSVFEHTESNTLITVFPNPTTSNIVRLNTGGLQGSIILSDVNGRLLLGQNVCDGEELTLPSGGVFFLHFQNAKGKFVQKVISIH
ncbi:MAG: T9SS type A sorting domain-containing protein [Saprospiraceae bacterium]|nr:T9SS type A sorting domain-containing protein [Saprospiraceae bacterium]